MLHVTIQSSLVDSLPRLLDICDEHRPRYSIQSIAHRNGITQGILRKSSKGGLIQLVQAIL